MNIEIKEIDSQKFNDVSEGLLILPHNYLSDDELEYHSTTLSFYKYAKDKLKIQCLTEPQLLIEQRSGEWFGPVLLITSAALSENPHLISITCSVVANYLTDFFKGKSESSIRLKVLLKETKTSKLTEISYDGSLEGLEQLKTSIEDVVRKGKIDE